MHDNRQTQNQEVHLIPYTFVDKKYCQVQMPGHEFLFWQMCQKCQLTIPENLPM